MCRLSTVRSADSTVVMDAGRIVEQGTHASLLAEGNIYAMLVRRQTQHSTDIAPPRDDEIKTEVMQTVTIEYHVCSLSNYKKVALMSCTLQETTACFSLNVVLWGRRAVA